MIGKFIDLMIWKLIGKDVGFLEIFFFFFEVFLVGSECWLRVI